MKNGKVIAIIQARMGSSRLPGKILKLLAGKPVLEHLVERLSYCKLLDHVVIATTVLQKDDVVEQFCLDRNIDCFRGSEDDVLDRYYQASNVFHADTIVRITADCPAIDPFIVDEVVSRYLQGEYDFYGLAGSFPNGLDCTVFRKSALDSAWKSAKLPSEREHVGPYIEKNPALFRLGGYHKFSDLGHHRWTLDEERDYVLLNHIFEHLYHSGKLFVTQDILNLLEKHPEYMTINSSIIRNEGYLKSLEKDKQFIAESI